MTKQEKQTLKDNLTYNLMFQILENQISSMNGVLTHEAQNKSNKLLGDCLEFNNIESEPKKDKPKTDNPEMNTIFNHWNSKECFTTHKSLTGNTTSIKSVLSVIKDTSIICKAIDNYEEIYLSTNHWYSTRLPLNKFLNYKINEFTDKSDPKNSPQSIFLKGRYGNQRTQQPIISDEESIRIAREAQESINI